MIIASLNKDLLSNTQTSLANFSPSSTSHTQQIFLTSLTNSKNEPILTSSPNSTLCNNNNNNNNKKNINTSNSQQQQQLQLINLNKITQKSSVASLPMKTINLMNTTTSKFNIKSNLLTTIDKLDKSDDFINDEDTFLNSNLTEIVDTNSSNMLDDSLTSLQWLQSLNLMKNATTSSCSLSPNSQTSDKSQNSLDCDLDSATIPAVNTLNSKSQETKNFNFNYPPLSPPLSIHCSTSPQSTCSSVTSTTKKRSKKINEHKTIQQQLQHQNSAPAVLQQTKPTSPTPTLFRNTSTYFKDREEYRTNSQVKPPYSYSQLIILSMKESKQSKMTLQMIYDWIIGNFSYFKKADPTWQVTFKNSIRHNLSLNKCFRKIARQKDEPGKGGFWTLDPEFEKQLDESNFLGPVNQKSQKRKRKINENDDEDMGKKSKQEYVQFNDLDSTSNLIGDANWSQQQQQQQQQLNNNNNFFYNYNYNVQYQQQQQQQQNSNNIAQIDIGETFSNSFSNDITLSEDPSLFNFEPSLVNFDIDQLTTSDSSSCTSNTSDDLVNEYLKKSSNFVADSNHQHNHHHHQDNELIELFEFTSQFNLDESINTTNLINLDKKNVNLTVQGHGINKPKWWMDFDSGFMNQTQDDECDSAMFINSQNSLDLGLNVDDFDFFNLDSSKEVNKQHQQQQQQQQQQAKKRIYTHQQNKFTNPAIQKTTTTRAKSNENNAK
ncbi:unnamed protein product [Brachionus calyciflorus]|uniref:Fork-head domain-containing protein n=1 Tax=Brachionus calyciflorus TaxID=104777 RepID=A0A813N2H9_9BILA|nr:unnamed protein product [Brachionus calyciflorus]